MMKLKDMRMGTFKGMTALDKQELLSDVYASGPRPALALPLSDPRLCQAESSRCSSSSEAGGGGAGRRHGEV